MKKTKKALASIAIASMVMTMVPFNAFAAGTVPTRIAGITAEDTAVKIADQTGYTATAILASSASYGMVDALTSGPLAAYLKAPILLTGAGDTLDAATKAELTKLAVKTVYVTSGTAVIKQSVLDELKVMGIDVIALGGFDRAETSVKIAQKMVGVTKVAIANGLQDALSIASVASAANEPILLTDKDVLPLSVEAFLKANPNITSSDVIGGTGIISDAVKAAVPSATRHYGVTAYDTNSQVIKDFVSSLEFNNVYVANGVTGIDALAGAPLAAQTKSAIVLTDGKTVPAIAPFVFEKKTATQVVTALGGEAVVPEGIRVGVATGVITIPTPGTTDLKIVSVNALDDSNKYIEIIFSKAVSGLAASDVTIENADTLERYGVKAVTLSSDGLTATAELYATEDDLEVLEYLQDYNVTVNANGTTLKATFNRSYSLKTRVVNINVADKEITVKVDKDSSQTDKEEGTEVKVTIPDSVAFDYQKALGELVQVWYDGDNELTKYKLLTTNSKVEAIEIKDDDTITLLGEDKDYDISTDEAKKGDKFTMTINGNDKLDVEDFEKLEDGLKYNFAKIGFDSSGDVEFISAYTLKDALVFDSLDDDEVVGIQGSSGSFDSSDATIIKDGKVIAAKDLKKGDLVLFNEDANDEDVYAEVISKPTATGEIEEVFAGSIEVDGETYDYDYDEDIAEDFGYNQEALYINEDGDLEEIDEDAADELQAAGDVSLYTDYAGNLIYVSGDTAEVDSNSKVAVLTDDMVGYTSARDKVEIEAVTADEKELSFDISLESLDTITVDGKEYDIDNDSSNDDWDASVIFDGKDDTGILLKENGGSKEVKIMFNKEADAGSLVKLHLDDDGNLEELEFFSGDSEDTGYKEFTSTLEAGDSYLDGFKLTSGTLLFDATDDDVETDGDKYNVISFDDYDGSDIPKGNFIYNDDQEVIAVWYGATSSDDITYQEAVVTKILRNTDDEVVSISGWVSGKEQTFKVDDVDDNEDIVKGDTVILEFDDDNDTLVQGLDTAKVGENKDQFTDRVSYGWTVTDVNSSDKVVKLKKGSTTIERKLADNGLVLDGTDDTDITKESLSDLKGETNVTVVLDGKTGTYTKFFVMEKAASFSTTPIVDAIDDANAAKKDVVVNTTASAVPKGTKWVTQATKDALEAAITTATNAKATVTTIAQVNDVVKALDSAVETYNAAKKDGTKTDEGTTSIKGTHTLSLGLDVVEVALAKSDVISVTVNGKTVSFGGTATVVRVPATADDAIVITTAGTVYTVAIQ